MGFYNGYTGAWVVKQYGKNYRDVRTPISNGVVTIRDTYKGKKSTIKCWVKNDEIVEQKQYVNGKYVYWVKWGDFEKARSNGDYLYIKRYRKGTARGLHSLQVRKDTKLEGYKGTCYTYYSRGKFLWQKFIYSNGRQAYYMRWTHQECKAVNPQGGKLFHIEVNAFHTKDNKECIPFIYVLHRQANESNFSTDGIYCEYTFWDKRGRVKHYGKYEYNQRVGEWVKNYRRYFYLSGIEVPKKLYEAEPQDINPRVVLKQANAQLRAMLLKKIGYDRVVSECKGKVIDRYQQYELIDFPVKHRKPQGSWDNPDKVLRILKVKSPSTKGNYFLTIPPTNDFATCKKARNGTFTGFEPNAEEVKFVKET